MYVLACIPIYGDRGSSFCRDVAGSQENPPELRLGCEPRSESAKSPLLWLPESRKTKIYLAGELMHAIAENLASLPSVN
jgi:hypothetical protein